MISRINIHHFRGIQNADLSNLKPLNLFFGRNNCGKSTMLEALFLACGQNNPILPVSINMMRAFGGISEDDTHVLFYGNDTSSPISIEIIEDQLRKMEISSYQRREAMVDLSQADNTISTSQPSYQYGLRTVFTRGSESFESELRFDVSQQQIRPSSLPDTRYKESIKCNYLSPGFDLTIALAGLDDMLKEKEEDILLDALRIIEPSVKDFQLVNGKLYVDVGLSHRIPVNVLGDGARKMMAIVTQIYACRGGVLLVDEISNGFHYSVMKQLWLMIIRALQKNHTQLFATTHDIDSIKGLNNALKEMFLDESIRDKQATMVKMVRDNHGVVSFFPYAPSQLSFAIEQEIEVR